MISTFYNARLSTSAALAGCVVLAALLSIGCEVRHAQTAVQTGLTTLAHGLDAVDQIVPDEYSEDADAARVTIQAEREEDPDMSVEVGMQRFSQLMQPMDRLIAGMGLAHRSLLLGQAALEVWLSSDQLPDEWGVFCEGIAESYGELLGLLEVADVTVPAPLRLAAPHAASVCMLASQFFSDGGE